jgi:hypothetical protein
MIVVRVLGWWNEKFEYFSRVKLDEMHVIMHCCLLNFHFMSKKFFFFAHNGRKEKRRSE